MNINYEKLLQKKNFCIDKELLERIEYKEILFILSKEIIEYREKYNLKQIDLAKKLNMSQVMISKMESGKYNFTIKSLVNLWNKLSTDKFNFGAKLLENIYKKVVKNYISIRVELNKNDIEEFDYNDNSTKIEKINITDAYTIEDYTYYKAC